MCPDDPDQRLSAGAVRDGVPHAGPLPPADHRPPRRVCRHDALETCWPTESGPLRAEQPRGGHRGRLRPGRPRARRLWSILQNRGRGSRPCSCPTNRRSFPGVTCISMRTSRFPAPASAGRFRGSLIRTRRRSTCSRWCSATATAPFSGKASGRRPRLVHTIDAMAWSPGTSGLFYISYPRRPGQTRRRRARHPARARSIAAKGVSAPDGRGWPCGSAWSPRSMPARRRVRPGPRASGRARSWWAISIYSRTYFEGLFRAHAGGAQAASCAAIRN